MPIGKDSIQKRVAKATPEVKDENVTEKITPPTEEKPATVKKTATPKKTNTTAKKTTATSTQKKTTTSASKKTSSAKPAAKKPATPKSTPATSVLANVSPETVEKVTGHKEGARPVCIGIGQKLPAHLL